MLRYEIIIAALREAIPEVDEMERVRMETDEELRALPYCCYFPAFSRLVLNAVQSENAQLIARCFDFMEEMAQSGDSGVNILLQVEVLEMIFELPYKYYILAEQRYMRPATQRLHEKNKASFSEPQP